MVILELAAQGLKGFAPSIRINFSQGYTLLQSQQAGGSLWRLLEALCYADVQADTAGLVASGASVGRVGLTFQGRDGETYRLVRELGGSGTLAKRDPGSGKFLPVTTDAAEMAQYLRASVGLPTRGVYQQAFAIVPGTWPSQRVDRPVSSPGLGRPTGSFPALQPSAALGLASGRAAVQPAADVPAAQALLVQLRAELEGAKEIDALQFKLDGLQKRVFDLSAQVRQVDELRRQAEQAQAAVAQMPSPAQLGLPENIAERAARFESAEKQRDDKLLRLEAEREKFLGQSFAIQPLYREPPFLAGVGLGCWRWPRAWRWGPGGTRSACSTSRRSAWRRCGPSAGWASSRPARAWRGARAITTTARRA